MKSPQRLALIILAAVLLVGFFTSIDLTYIHYEVVGTDGTYKSFCNINDSFNCDVVAQSRYSTIFGVPIAIFGMLTYLFSLVLVGGRLWPARWPFKGTGAYLAWISVGSVLYSLFLAAICIFEIGAWCVMCMVLYGVNLAFIILALYTLDLPWRKHMKALNADIRWFFAKATRFFAALAVGIALLVGLSLSAHDSVPKEAGGVTKVDLARLEKEGVIMGEDGTPRYMRVDMPLTVKGAILGNPNGKQVITLYSDYQCPFCAITEHLLELLMPRYPELKVIRKDFPLDNTCNPLLKQPFHENSCLISTYAKCAARQGKYQAFHTQLVANHDKLSPAFLDAIAFKTGMDLQAAKSCLSDEAVRLELAAEIDEGIKLKLRGTPALVFNGRYLVVGGVEREELEHIINTWMK